MAEEEKILFVVDLDKYYEIMLALQEAEVGDALFFYTPE